MYPYLKEFERPCSKHTKCPPTMLYEFKSYVIKSQSFKKSLKTLTFKNVHNKYIILLRKYFFLTYRDVRYSLFLQ